MELILNFGWAVVAVCMICAWLRLVPAAAQSRRAQLVALAVVVLILLPAISMTDDLIAAQNPAEVVLSVRRDHDDFVGPHSIVPLNASLPLPAFASLEIADSHLAAPGHLSAPFVESLFAATIQSRPPPHA